MALHRIILNIPDIIKKDNQKDKKENELTKQILVGISDTDRGISSQIMPKLFEKSITGSDTGTGLGLCSNKNIVEAHGGRIWAFNNNDGVGATFVFTLPKANE